MGLTTAKLGSRHEDDVETLDPLRLVRNLLTRIPACSHGHTQQNHLSSIVSLNLVRTGNKQTSVQPGSQRSKQFQYNHNHHARVRAGFDRLSQNNGRAAEAQPRRARSLSEYYPRSLPDAGRNQLPSPPSFGRRW